MLEERSDMSGRDFWRWSKDDTRRYFAAGGGREDELAPLWTMVTEDGDKFLAAIAARTYAGSGAAIQYVVAGRKP
jgi:hypothetical protein